MPRARRCRRRLSAPETRAARSTAADASPRAFRTRHYVEPAIVEMPDQSEVVREETFAPILYTLRYESFDEAIAIQNAVPQGLSSWIFTQDLREAETFLSASGSDCGIANVNIGPSAPRSAARSAARRRRGAGARRLRRLEGLYAPADEHGELFGQATTRTREVRFDFVARRWASCRPSSGPSGHLLPVGEGSRTPALFGKARCLDTPITVRPFRALHVRRLH